MNWIKNYKNILTRYRKHNFDLNNPIIMKIEGTKYSYNKYICENCGYSLSLDHWQMLDLPFEMARGCLK
jgi:hypothetical protein